MGVKAAEGFFHRDMRHLSTWRLLGEGEPIHVLASSAIGYSSGRIVGSSKQGECHVEVGR
ncbi:MAG: hypothetical protein H0T39_11775 [Actinobacteria bacterium]|nr:hypothetical protein [Actinomycetota bacterium]